MGAWRCASFWVVVAVGFCLLGAPGVTRGQQGPPEVSEEEEIIEKTPPPEKEPVKAPAETPGYFPGGLPPAPYTALETGTITGLLGPVTGPLAPYGNAGALDTLKRGWLTHRLGPVVASPVLDYDAVYRSNVFRTTNNPQSDFANVINPGLNLEVPLAQRHKLSFGYLGNYFIYSRFGDQMDHFDQNVNADVNLNFRSGLSLRVGDAFQYATIEPSPENARKRPYYRDSPYINATYGVTDKFKLQGFYQFDYINFQDSVDQFDNYRYQYGGITAYYKFWPKTSALVQYIVSYQQYPNDPTSNSFTQTPLIGLTWDPTAKLTGTVKFGVSFVNYDHSLPTRNNSPTNFACSVQTLYRFSRYTNLSLTVQRSKQDDTDFNNAGYWNTGVFVALSHDWTAWKLASYLGVAYTNNHYLSDAFNPSTGTFERRDENIFYIGGGLSRPITRWLRMRLDYAYYNDASNFGGFNYHDHRVLLGVQTTF